MNKFQFTRPHISAMIEAYILYQNIYYELYLFTEYIGTSTTPPYCTRRTPQPCYQASTTPPYQTTTTPIDYYSILDYLHRGYYDVSEYNLTYESDAWFYSVGYSERIVTLRVPLNMATGMVVKVTHMRKGIRGVIITTLGGIMKEVEVEGVEMMITICGAHRVHAKNTGSSPIRNATTSMRH